MARSWDAIAGADAVLFVHDLTRRGEALYEAAERQIAERLPAGMRVLHVHNKADALRPSAEPTTVESGEADQPEGIAVSAKSGSGLDTLRQALLGVAGWQPQSEGVFIARTRHLDALRRTRNHLERAQGFTMGRSPALDLLAEELRLGHDCLGEITGTFTPDDLLGEIFSRFCIGK